jgi:putative ABC transport system ATP-binding protein
LYKNVKIYNQVFLNKNLTINSGEIVIITALYGSAKTTLLSLAGGILLAQYESLLILVNELFSANAQQLNQARRSNGYIFQYHDLHASLIAVKNV